MIKNTTYQEVPILIQDTLAAGSTKDYTFELSASGRIKKVHIKFATGENGTLHIHPFVIQNGEIPTEILKFAAGSQNYVAGDDEHFDFDCYLPVENHAVLHVIADNTGAAPSMVDVAVIVEYFNAIRHDGVIN